MIRPYLLDTNIASYIIKGNRPDLLRRVTATPMPQLAVSTVTEGELRFGVARLPANARLQKLVDEFLIRVTVFPWDAKAAREYGALRAALENTGDGLGNLDMMIAAHALALGAVLVTNDHAFGCVTSLRIEDWTRPAQA